MHTFWTKERDPTFIPREMGDVCSVNKSLGNLDSPLFSHLVNSKHGDSHNCDHASSDDGENAFPEVFCRGPDIMTKSVEHANEGTTDSKTNKDANCGTGPDLENHALVEGLIHALTAKSLFQECENNRDDD